MPRNTPSGTICLYASHVEVRVGGFGLAIERLGAGHYAFRRNDGFQFGSSPEKIHIHVSIAPPKCDEKVLAVFITCPLHKLSCPPCCDEMGVKTLESVLKYTPVVSAAGPRSFEVSILETANVENVDSPPQEESFRSDADFYVMVSLPREVETDNLTPCSPAK